VPAFCRDPEDREIQRELLTLKRVQKEEQKATASLFKGALGPPPKPKPGSGLDDIEPEQPAAGEPAAAEAPVEAAAGGAAGSAAARRTAAAAAADVSRSSSSSRGGGGFLQPLFALLAMLLGWLGQLLGLVKRPRATQAASR
jgi:hypothetical protein